MGLKWNRRWQVAALWICANSCAFAVAGLVVENSWRVNVNLYPVLAPALFALTLGLSQWCVLRPTSRPWLWVCATAGGWAFGYPVYHGMPRLLSWWSELPNAP